MLVMRARTAARVVGRLSPRAAEIAARALGPWLALARPRAHRAWKRNVERLGAAAGSPDPVGPHRAHLLTLYECLALLAGRSFDVRIEGQRHVNSALASGSGVLFVTAHVGGWLVAGSRFAQLAGRPVHSVAGVQMLRGWTAEIRRGLRHRGIRVHDARRTAITPRLARILRGGGVIALHLDGDRHARAGAAARGAGVLARRTGAVVLPAVCLREPGGRHVLVVGPPRAGRGFTQESADDLLRMLAATRAEQWAVFRPLWNAA